jgi:hypothetical protein
MSQAITQDFQIEILTGTLEAKIAPALCEAVTHWEREFNDDEDEDEEESFLVRDSDQDQDDDDADDGTDDDEDERVDEEPEYEVETSDSTLTLSLPASVEALADIKALQAMDPDDHVTVRIVYGSGALVRQFVISPDVTVLLSSGNRVDAPAESLTIQVVADIFEAEVIF